MPGKDLNHINIQAGQPLLDQIRDFYVSVIGLSEGWRPAVPVPGYWLYLGDRAVVHLVEMAGSAPSSSSLPALVDHIAFTCTDIDGMQAHLKTLNVPFRRQDAPDFGFSQLVLKDPAGFGVELNFAH